MDLGNLEQLALAGFFTMYNTAPRLDFAVNNLENSELCLKNLAKLSWQDTRDCVKEYLNFLRAYFS